MILEVSGIRAKYGFVEVLHGIDLTVDTGTICAVLGANGAGKTTLLRALSRMIASTGTVKLAGESIAGKSVEQVVRLGMSHVPQGRGTFTDLTVQENLMIGGYLQKRERDSDIERWYEVFPRLRERRNEAGGNLSGGEQQMLAVARALMTKPKLLLLDEPSAGLAPIAARGLFATLKEVSNELQVAMLVVEQNVELALEIASSSYVLEAGTVTAAGDAETLRANGAIVEAYLGY